ncbi:rhamnogalacturonan acetylesterase [Amycolatopsis sp. NPDC058278]|uniref:rhamnogalacturonan acetylesterase n=1 Tax=Amycolatopsis sp. NPDC058278 TaxID=3346417 RepID=UPI0036DB43E7
MLVPAVSVLLALSALPGSPGTMDAVDYSFNVPPGDYEVTLTLGSATQAAQTAVQVEARRTVLAPVSTRAGEFRREVPAVNVRSPESMPTGEEGTGTPGLQVHLTGARPAAANVSVAPARRPRLFVVSDSTASDWLQGPKRGWAQELPQLLRPGIVVANYADGVRERGGLPVLVTPPVRHQFGPDGKLTPTGLIVNNLGVDLPAVIRGLAGKLHVPLIDLTARSQALLERLGETASWPLYLTVQHDGVQDYAHFSEYGGAVMAGLVTKGMADAQLPAAAFLR